ncbi:hypothetical protein OsI_19519 [Oryza sativa Indica Group]|uniref:Guanine nucleotide-binding protein alpha subunit n=1 Tax=Oryza sativa subsp. indica TaxID=39946 RepID=B8AWP9_ORYSI|nr:hypothetical protein OsI_19519 [Oryza sativa Indica Group]
MSVLTYVLDNIGSSCSRSHSLSEAETAENAKIKLLFQTGFDEAELRSYTSVIHANVYQTIKILYEGAKELSQVESDSSKYVISPDNQETYLRGSILQLPDCAQYFMENLDRLAEADYVPTKDTAGQEKFHALGPIYYRDADAALLVYDITDNDTFLRVTKWVKELKQMANKDIVMAIAANKSDLVRSKHIDTNEAASYAESIGATLFVTSAKAGTGIDDIFSDIAKNFVYQTQLLFLRLIHCITLNICEFPLHLNNKDY